MPFKVALPENGKRNARIVVTGVIECNLGPHEVISLDTLDCEKAKIESAVWIIQEKLGIVLWWGVGEPPTGVTPEAPDITEKNLVFVMESRNGIRFDHGLDSPRSIEKWDRKLWLQTFGFTSNAESPKYFTFTLDFDKQ